MIIDKRIDEGKAFDWGRASSDYAKYRDIYPQAFYNKIIEKKLCIEGQNVLDVGTGTGVLPRNLYKHNANFTGTDISEEQIEMAKELSKELSMNINYVCVPTEALEFKERSFDVISACQCFFYFNHEIVVNKFHELLKPNGKLLLLYMAWLPFEDKIAGGSESLVLKYNPKWTGKGETRHKIEIPKDYLEYFDVESEEVFDVLVPFTRETWNGRMRACRGIGASLCDEDIQNFNKEHMKLLEENAPNEFEVLHYVGMSVLSKM